MNLNDDITDLPFVGTAYARKLSKLGIESVGDLLHHLPSRYLDYRDKTRIKDLEPDETVTTEGIVDSIKNVYTKSGKIMQLMEIKDGTGKANVVWFNQPYLVKSFNEGEKISFSGKVGFWSRKIALISPEYEKKGQKLHTGRLVPIYPETAGVSSKWLRRRISDAYKKTGDKIQEFLPDRVLKNNDLIDFKTAISKAHFPKDLEEAELGRRRLALNELIYTQLKGFKRKKRWEEEQTSHSLTIDKKLIKSFKDNLPFELTNSQKQVLKEIAEDLQREIPMNRLLEGDVGSGKTVVAAFAVFAAFSNGYQTAFMAPTQILAEQHFDTLNNILSKFKVRTTLVTSSTKKGDLGKADVFVGTHALFHDNVDFDEVSLIVIDEQHRFGVKQRALLSEKASQDKTPHVLTMTATPIPRTVALTLYGDLNLSLLKEMPKGRKEITTWIVPPKKRKSAREWVRDEIEKKDVQAFLICPLIEESDKELMNQVKAVTREYGEVKEDFPSLEVGLLHGKLKSDEKTKVIEEFRKGKIDILVSTPVVEVGIDVQNATIMIIETAERFGLAQLHQLRGRVGRGEKKSYCLLFTDVKSEKVQKRLSLLKKTMSGFELAERDLELRGPGEVFGTRQHGFPELKIAKWNEDEELVKLARGIAKEAVEKPEDYKYLNKVAEEASAVPN